MLPRSSYAATPSIPLARILSSSVWPHTRALVRISVTCGSHGSMCSWANDHINVEFVRGNEYQSEIAEMCACEYIGGRIHVSSCSYESARTHIHGDSGVLMGCILSGKVLKKIAVSEMDLGKNDSLIIFLGMITFDCMSR